MAARPRVTSRSARIRRAAPFSSVAGYRVLVRTARSTSPARSGAGDLSLAFWLTVSLSSFQRGSVSNLS